MGENNAGLKSPNDIKDEKGATRKLDDNVETKELTIKLKPGQGDTKGAAPAKENSERRT